MRLPLTLLLFIVVFSNPIFSKGFVEDFSSFFQNPFSNFSSRSSQHQTEQAEPETATSKCYEELGCLENTHEWFHLLHRPVNLLPQGREKVNTRFIFYNRNRKEDPVEVFANDTHLAEQGFDSKKPIVIITHGYIDTGFSFWVIKLVESLLIASDYNIFVVDWGGGSLPLYTQATANTRLVGLEIAFYIAFLQEEFQVKSGSIHCIGHSLGSHVCGYTGENIRGLGRITGLDPAEPFFQYMPAHVRLDPSDAKFVDVVHTDGRTILLLGYGMIQPCGHVDFYPNDGKEQPGCELTEIPINLLHSHGYEEAQREIFACNHHRAIFYFIEAIQNSCQYVGHACEDYPKYLKGECWPCNEDESNCALMGLDAAKYAIGNRSLVKFYLSTGKTSPFCVRHYRINIQLAWPQQAADWVQGKLKISIFGTRNTFHDINLTHTNSARFHHGTNLTFMVNNSEEMGILYQVKVEWKYDHGYLDFMSTCWSYLCNNKLFIKKIEVWDIDDINRRKDGLTTFCSEEGTTYTGIRSGLFAFFKRQC